MKNKIASVKEKLDMAISQLCEVSWMFSKKPGVYFSRNRKLPFPKIMSTILSMEGGSLTSELLKYFGCSADIASSSAFVQQRGKLSEEAFPMLFSLFAQKTDSPKLYKGLRLVAADGSDIQIPSNLSQYMSVDNSFLAIYLHQMLTLSFEGMFLQER